MKEELIKLAREKEFYSKVFRTFDTNQLDDESIYYLWMCELQQWLRVEYDLYIDVVAHFTFYTSRQLYYGVRLHRLYENEFTHKFDMESFGTYEESLEIGLLEALKFIKWKQL